MNQTEQMRDKVAFLEARREQALNQLNSFFYAGVKAAEDWQAIAAEPTPNHYEQIGYAHYERGKLILLGRNDVCMDQFAIFKQTSAANSTEPAPLVRLTEDEIDDLWDAHLDACEKLTGKRGYNAHKFYQEAMDAMERVNRRQLDQTPKTPSE